MKKLDKDDLLELADKHLFKLEKEEVEALAFVYGVEVSEFVKGKFQVSFTMTNCGKEVRVRCMYNSDISIYIRRKSPNSLPIKKRHDNHSKFPDLIRLFIWDYHPFNGYMMDWEDNGEYSKTDRTNLVKAAFTLIGIRIKIGKRKVC